MERAYLDWNATAPLRPQALAAMTAALELSGNPSSVHREGRAARRIVEDARGQVAALVGADPAHVTFTASATEANMMALTPTVEKQGDGAPRGRLLISAVEHPSVRTGGRFAAFDQIGVDRNGVLDLAALKALLQRGARPLVSVMLANNESGVVQPIREIADVTHEAGGLLHVDAVQGPGRIAFDINGLGADLLTLSAHKLGGPKGVGALIRAEGIHIADPLIRGGGQERGTRAGTENVAAIAGFGAAAAVVAAEGGPEASRIAALRDRLEARLREITPDAVIFGQSASRLPNTTLVALPGLKAETAVIALDLDGVAVSSGSACSSGKVQPSHVLAAMGVEPALAQAAIRVSIGNATLDSDLEKFQNAWTKLAKTLGKGREQAA
jgi:cysteine desulfurase